MRVKWGLWLTKPVTGAGDMAEGEGMAGVGRPRLIIRSASAPQREDSGNQKSEKHSGEDQEGGAPPLLLFCVTDSKCRFFQNKRAVKVGKMLRGDQ